MSYINGSDLLLKVGGQAVGHCSSHTLTFNSETKDRAVKPAATESQSSGLWKGKGVVGMSVSISAEGLRFFGEKENGYEQIAPLWGKGQSVEVVAMKRGEDTKPYLKGKFVISTLEETSPAQDDATFSISLDNDGEPDVYPGKAGGYVSLNASRLKMKVGSKVTLQPVVLPDSTPVTWSSSADGKASVAEGLVTGVAAGTATITAQITVAGVVYKDTCVVTVE